MGDAVMHKTKNDLPEDIRGQIVEILNARLADAIDLKLQAKQAHWNVKGANFIALHELFDQVATDADTYVDDIAERAVQLGGTAHGTVQTVADRSTLREYPLDIAEGAAHVEALSGALAAFGKKVREAIDETAALQDADTADLFTGISRGVDKHLWFVEAHNQA
jgi:starvation-inducible DNA-binding protein